MIIIERTCRVKRPDGNWENGEYIVKRAFVDYDIEKVNMMWDIVQRKWA